MASFVDKVRAWWKRGDKVSTEVGHGMDRRDVSIEYGRGSMLMTGAQGGADPVLKQAGDIDARVAQQETQLKYGSTEQAADTGEALEKDIDKYVGDLEKWKREDTRLD
jgi:hypothetical protein